jgi:hypothetical protein
MLQDDYFGIEEINAQTKTLHWFFTDIVGSSDPKIQTKSQIRKINSLYMQIRNTDAFKNAKNHCVIVPTGDGMAMGFTDSPETPLRLAIQLHELLGKYNKTKSLNDKIAIRIGIDTGPVYFIKDVLGTDTVWGPGIILSRRLMDLCGANQIFASRKIGDDVSKLSPEYKAIMHPIGDYAIKHGEQHMIYNVYGKGFGNKFAPKKGKIIAKPKEDDFIDPIKFEFNSIEIRLDILEPKTMMTRHTWVWDVKNTKTEPLKEIYYEINGDVPKEDFSDLNLSIKDENNNELKILSLDENEPLAKKFHVQLATPLRKNHKMKIILTYDWEEPKRYFQFSPSAKCKTMKYVFTIPKDVPIANRILKVIPNLGMKKRAEPPPKITYSKDKIKIEWETTENQIIMAYPTYEFKW